MAQQNAEDLPNLFGEPVAPIAMGATSGQTYTQKGQMETGSESLSVNQARASRTSITGYVLPEDKEVQQNRPLRVVCVGIICAGISYMLILMVNLNASMNYILNGDSKKVSSESQLWFSLAFLVKQMSSVWLAEFIGQGGSTWGRKKMASVALAAYATAAVLSLMAHVLNSVMIHIVAQFVLGMWSPILPTATGYIADVSTREDYQKNFGQLHASMMIGLFIGAAAAAALSATVVGGYVAAAFVALVGMVFLSMGLPDWSPPRDCRQRMLWVSCIPCHVCPMLMQQNAYTKWLSLVSLLGATTVASLQTWNFNYMMIRYGFTVQGCALWLMVLFLSGVFTAAIFMRFVKLKCAIGFGNVSMCIPLLMMVFCPAKPLIMWLALIPMQAMNLAGPSLLAIFYGQKPSAERGTLAGLQKLSDSSGRLIGVLIAGVVTTLWLKDVEDGTIATDASGGFQPPMITLVFLLLTVLCYLFAEGRYGSQDVKLYQTNEAEEITQTPQKTASTTSTKTSTSPSMLKMMTSTTSLTLANV